MHIDLESIYITKVSNTMVDGFRLALIIHPHYEKRAEGESFQAEHLAAINIFNQFYQLLGGQKRTDADPSISLNQAGEMILRFNLSFSGENILHDFCARYQEWKAAKMLKESSGNPFGDLPQRTTPESTI